MVDYVFKLCNDSTGYLDTLAGLDPGNLLAFVQEIRWKAARKFAGKLPGNSLKYTAILPESLNHQRSTTGVTGPTVEGCN